MTVLAQRETSSTIMLGQLTLSSGCIASFVLPTNILIMSGVSGIFSLKDRIIRVKGERRAATHETF